MSGQRDIGQSVLQVVFSVFLGLVVLGFVGIGVNTALPQPLWEEGSHSESAQRTWQLTTSIALLVCATLVMLVSLLRSERWLVLTNGALIGGLFTMVYAVGMSIEAGNEWQRFAVISLALVVTVMVGWWRFGRRTPAPAPAAAAGSPAVGVPAETEARLAAVEAKLDALGRALRD